MQERNYRRYRGSVFSLLGVSHGRVASDVARDEPEALLMRIDKSVEAHVTDSQGYKDAQQTLNQIPNVLGDF